MDRYDWLVLVGLALVGLGAWLAVGWPGLAGYVGAVLVVVGVVGAVRRGRRGVDDGAAE
jgi:hypothetical protein